MLFTKQEQQLLKTATHKYWAEVILEIDFTGKSVVSATITKEDLFPQEMITGLLIPIFCDQGNHSRRELGSLLDDQRTDIFESIDQIKDLIQHSPTMQYLHKRVSLKKKSAAEWTVTIF